MVDRRFSSKDFEGKKDYVIGLEDLKDIFKEVISKELMDKIEKEIKNRIG